MSCHRVVSLKFCFCFAEGAVLPGYLSSYSTFNLPCSSLFTWNTTWNGANGLNSSPLTFFKHFFPCKFPPFCRGSIGHLPLTRKVLIDVRQIAYGYRHAATRLLVRAALQTPSLYPSLWPVQRHRPVTTSWRPTQNKVLALG